MSPDDRRAHDERCALAAKIVDRFYPEHRDHEGTGFGSNIHGIFEAHGSKWIACPCGAKLSARMPYGARQFGISSSKIGVSLRKSSSDEEKDAAAAAALQAIAPIRRRWYERKLARAVKVRDAVAPCDRSVRQQRLVEMIPTLEFYIRASRIDQ